MSADPGAGDNEMKEKVLADLSPYLCRSLGDPSRYIPHLMARDNLLDLTDRDAIRVAETSQRKKEVFMKILKRKGACAFDGFVAALLEVRVESHIARKLLQALKNERENARSPSPTATSKETVDNDKKVFKSHYHKFCDTLTDIENLLKYFITENIINSDDQSEILATPRPSQKVVLLLKHISGPLEAGSTKPFRMMLDIMEKHGILGTKHLAISVRKCLTTTSQDKEDIPPRPPPNKPKRSTTCPFAAPHWNTAIMSQQFDHNGGTLTIEKHDITIVIPQHAVSQGDTVEVQAAAAMLAPYLLPAGYDPVSVFVWMEGDYMFNKTIKVIVPHCAAVGDDGTTQLTVLTTTGSDLTVQQVDDNHRYRIGDLECHYYTNQLCSLCVARKQSCYPGRTRLLLLYCFSKDYKTADKSTIEFSLCFDLKYCVKRAKKYYKQNRSLEKPCMYQWLIVIDHSKQQKFKLLFSTDLTGWVISSFLSTKIDIKDMEFPKCISEVIAQHKTEQSPFPPRIGVSLTRQSEYDDLATELKIYLENNTTMTTNCVKLPIDISKLKSKPKPEGAHIANNNNPANQHNTENSRTSNSLQCYADDITTMVDVDTIVSPMMKYGLLTLDQQQQLTSLHVTTTKKQQTLCGIVLALDEVHVDKFLQCLSETSSYEPHNTLVKKIKYDMMRNTSHSDV